MRIRPSHLLHVHVQDENELVNREVHDICVVWVNKAYLWRLL